MSREEESSESESGEVEARERDERDGGEEVVEGEGADEKGRDRTMDARIGIPSGEGKLELSVRCFLACQHFASRAGNVDERRKRTF